MYLAAIQRGWLQHDLVTTVRTLKGMHLPQGTHTLSPDASACGVHCNRHIAGALQSHHRLERPPGDTASPNHPKDSWSTSLHNRPSLLQHPTAGAATSPVTTVLVRSQQMRMMMHTLRSVHPLLETFKRPPELARHCKCHTQNSFTRAYGPRVLPDHPACFLWVTTGQKNANHSGQPIWFLGLWFRTHFWQIKLEMEKGPGIPTGHQLWGLLPKQSQYVSTGWWTDADDAGIIIAGSRVTDHTAFWKPAHIEDHSSIGEGCVEVKKRSYYYIRS